MIHKNHGLILTSVLRSQFSSFPIQYGNKMQKINLLVVHSELL